MGLKSDKSVDGPETPYVPPPPTSSVAPQYKVILDSSSDLVEEIVFTNVMNHTIAPWKMEQDEDDDDFTPPEAVDSDKLQ